MPLHARGWRNCGVPDDNIPVPDGFHDFRNIFEQQDANLLPHFYRISQTEPKSEWIHEDIRAGDCDTQVSQPSKAMCAGQYVQNLLDLPLGVISIITYAPLIQFSKDRSRRI